MPSDFKRIRYLRPKYSQKSYHMLMKTMENSLAIDISDVAKFRIHVINLYYKYGLCPTLDAFKIKKSTFYDWKKTYETNGKRIISLVPHMTRPLHVRKMETDWHIVAFIKEMRKEHGNIGKCMLKPFIDAYARQLGIPTIGHSTIGKIIKRRQFKFKKLRVRKSPKVTAAGFIEMDSIVVYINHERHFFMCVIDVFTKYAHVTHVDNLSSATAVCVFKEFKATNPTIINTVQTDNGSEFLKSFHDHLEKLGIVHQFIYPKMPKINGFIERFNRTVQEEVILRNDEIYYDRAAFAKKLKEYLYWYNNRRPHSSLNYLPPMTFIQTKIPKST